MNVVFSIRTVIVSVLISSFIVIPKVLLFLGLENPILAALATAWAAFFVIFVACLILFLPYIIQPKLTMIMLIISLIIAIVVALSIS